MPMIVNKSVIIFDLFHTLTSTIHTKTPGRETSEILGVDRNEWNRMLFDYSCERLSGQIMEPVTIIRTLLDKMGVGVPESVIVAAAESRADRFRYTLIHPLPEVVWVLRELRKRGKRLALLSNADVMEAAGWTESEMAALFEVAVFSCDVGLVKPDPRIYTHCLGLLGAQPEEAVFVGDGGCDEFRGAREAGIVTICSSELLRDIWPEKVDVRKMEADYHVERLEDLLQLLRE